MRINFVMIYLVKQKKTFKAFLMIVVIVSWGGGSIFYKFILIKGRQGKTKPQKTGDMSLRIKEAILESSVSKLK